MFSMSIDWASLAHLITTVAITIAILAVVIFVAGVVVGWALATLRRRSA
jgi:hypothetical protein